MPGRVNIPVFSPYLYHFRNLVERFFNKIKYFMAIATRFENETPTTSLSSNSPPRESGCAS
jgi:transposase